MYLRWVSFPARNSAELCTMSILHELPPLNDAAPVKVIMSVRNVRSYMQLCGGAGDGSLVQHRDCGLPCKDGRHRHQGMYLTCAPGSSTVGR